MEKLETALDDLDGLLELYRALSDDARTGRLRGGAVAPLKELRRNVAAAADAYAATLMASSGGEVTAQRIAKCRKNAEAAMKAALARQKELAALVHQQRLPPEPVREDVKQLVTLSLQCRAGVAALAASPVLDTKAADAIANKVLVDLREATLVYLARARDSGGADEVKPRAAVVALLEKTGAHAAELARLEEQAAERAAGSVKNILQQDVNALLRRTACDWGLGAEQAKA